MLTLNLHIVGRRSNECEDGRMLAYVEVEVVHVKKQLRVNVASGGNGCGSMLDINAKCKHCEMKSWKRN